MNINSAYVCVKDMNRAISFYKNFFEKEPFVNDTVFSKFDINGFRFCLFNNKDVNESVTFGDNCLLSIEVEHIHETMVKVVKLGAKIVYPLSQIGKNWVFEFQDTEGNDVEVYSSVY